VDLGSNAPNPPNSPLLLYTPVLWEYRPVRMLARLGQQMGFTTKALLKLTPCFTRSLRTFGIAHKVSGSLIVGDDQHDVRGDNASPRRCGRGGIAAMQRSLSRQGAARTSSVRRRG
jgi:hypothetical protein